ncbi:hypothetical protein BDV96DRAFT_603004 [Lophiotrema nucula]|uniref:Uncharacterized protein n=1 Tax=Lophiotrema nucula TaxID=690887 RepID=A0A6A5YWB5_9PLEO|nr:hypothetical protein BDV96DRAFT_603004 [Lophiotrema nucula]
MSFITGQSLLLSALVLGTSVRAAPQSYSQWVDQTLVDPVQSAPPVSYSEQPVPSQEQAPVYTTPVYSAPPVYSDSVYVEPAPEPVSSVAPAPISSPVPEPISSVAPPVDVSQVPDISSAAPVPTFAFGRRQAWVNDTYNEYSKRQAVGTGTAVAEAYWKRQSVGTGTAVPDAYRKRQAVGTGTAALYPYGKRQATQTDGFAQPHAYTEAAQTVVPTPIYTPSVEGTSVPSATTGVWKRVACALGFKSICSGV